MTGVQMESRADAYRVTATYCAKVAKSSGDAKDKRRFERLAQQWQKLADLEGKITEGQEPSTDT